MNVQPKVRFTEALGLFWKNYVNFRGRSRRSEYWFMTLWHLIFMSPAILLMIIGSITLFIGLSSSEDGAAALGAILLGLTLIYIAIYAIITLIPNLALTVRRFHDISKTMFLPIFMVVYSVFVIIIVELLPMDDFGEFTTGSTIVLVVIYILNFVLSILMLVFSLLDSKPANKYGDSPKYPSQY
ncbi:DUF805 domain-containing protein [Staphylococcus simiae]|uniref:DUF805 domain-containing protein n=1 Tax=Staphylococcus simiae TaxID=308354 RepID=UPI001A960D35|nr:DUF805 domain-containing protein [Staphylococcus simiae]MBO1198652.1 DUF805 domain-containing protein [Staphylococcus simiae]MBO1200863.1 DUF805 domain-containing protein [Staphylococcus simiae]MBO1203071.1 DUF805 domain-containing protein [Staphylococcus simiae]MBO1211278.1 DUF805 domain-containing protein [Staphylococcus simiae]MBO1229199.1 DUF805 domain-containing protein [Staphylococcus simiae]